ncbi:phytoene desaturase family protein [Halostagnicola kamekurae]|uniref:Pyridine nucleotide-disulfide oxidoreductase domain-containing protein 2 n=1 Tax=Halostagnicola kamekurae TaxID=619731 RepID=A0A1I6UCC5_9EURY|nr:NAD(P)/FAD-dependent oxidoreductase [Halostagnicola kamekurae]SFS99070.1 Phytoene dehydrogenase-related protein [Halostagnicola kamekurae]
MAETYDAIVVGAGHNGLTAALYLADEGWDVCVLERNDKPGGSVRSDELTRESYIHDTHSTNQNLFLGSQVFEEFGDELREAGLAFSQTDKPFANVYPGGDALRVYQDADRTREEFQAHSPADAEGWETLHEEFGRFAKNLAPLLGQPLPSVAAGRTLIDAARREGPSGLVDLAQIPLSSTRELGDAYFETPEAKALMACWGLHIDFGPDVSGGAMFPFLESFTALSEGISVATGGASAIPEALTTLIEARGGEIRTNAEVTAVDTQNGRATGVTLADGTTVRAREAVVANLTPTVLYDRLVDDNALPGSFREKVDRYEYGPGTMMIHLALDDLPNWEAGAELSEFAYVHIAPSVDDLAETYTAAQNGQLPESPLLVVGQTTAVDETRTPDNGHILWVQVRALPSEIEGDAADEIETTDWEVAAEPMAERVLDKLETYAPGIRDSIRDRDVHSPADLEATNPNLVGGDSVAGSHHLRQNFLWRPFPGWSRYGTPVEDLYVCGASTWPGAGNNAASGRLCAHRVLTPPFEERAIETAEEYVGDATAAIRRRLS